MRATRWEILLKNQSFYGVRVDTQCLKQTQLIFERRLPHEVDSLAPRMSCPDCFKGAIHSHAGEAKGTTETLYGRTCYIASPPTKTNVTSNGATIIYITDSFGLNLINAKLLADRFATETGCRVLVPDVVPGGGISIAVLAANERADEPVAWWDVLGQLRRVYNKALVGFLTFRVLLWSSPKAAYHNNVLPFARAVRAGLPAGAKLGVVGFCWGGYGSTNLCKESAMEGGSERLIDVQFCGHPYGLTTPDMVIDAVTRCKVPYSMAIGDKDRWLSKDKVEQTRAALNQVIESGGGESGYSGEIRVYEGCTHGFVVRAKPGNEVETSAAEEARVQAVDWLKRYL